MKMIWRWNDISATTVSRAMESSPTVLKTSSGSVLDSHAYTYNVGNQRTNQTFTDSSTVAYRYDKIGQLTVADSSINSEDRGYAYDAAWPREIE